MKKNLIFLLTNNYNNTSNFYNYLTQINLKIKIMKLEYFNQKNIKILIINDNYIKINQFLKSIKKCLNIKKIFSYENIKTLKYKKIYKNNFVKFYKNFLFIKYFKNFLLIFNNKKKNYFNSILNNYIIFNNLYI